MELNQIYLSTKCERHVPFFSKDRSSHRRCFVRKGVFRNFAIFKGKHLYRPQACNFIKKETLAQVFSYEFCKISKNTFFIEHLRTTASERKRAHTSYSCLTLFLSE